MSFIHVQCLPVFICARSPSMAKSERTEHSTSCSRLQIRYHLSAYFWRLKHLNDYSNPCRPLEIEVTVSEQHGLLPVWNCAVLSSVWVKARGGTPYVMGDTYVPRFWPPFFTLAGSSTIFLGYFFSSTNTKTIFWGIKTTNSYRIRSFRPQISFFPRSFWVQFSAASGTPPSFFGPSTPPGGQGPTGLLTCGTNRVS